MGPIPPGIRRFPCPSIWLHLFLLHDFDDAGIASLHRHRFFFPKTVPDIRRRLFADAARQIKQHRLCSQCPRAGNKRGVPQ